MNPTRREARRLRPSPPDTRLFALALCLVLAAGCGRSPKPRADVPTDTTRAGRSGAVKRPPANRPGPGAVAPGVVTGSSTSSPAVVPQLAPEEQERLERAARTAMETAQKALDAVDPAKLDVERNRKYLIARDFLAQAAEARTRREYERAQGLAQKARLLAEEIGPR